VGKALAKVVEVLCDAMFMPIVAQLLNGIKSVALDQVGDHTNPDGESISSSDRL